LRSAQATPLDPGEATVSIWATFKRRAKTVAVVALVLWKDWRQKPPASSRWENLTQDERVERLLWVAAQNIDICKKVLPDNYAKNDFEYVARNSAALIEGHLERLALLHRARSDKVAARAELRATRELLDHIEDAIAKSNAIGLTDTNFIHVTWLTPAFLACFLANDWERAQRLAHAARLPVMQEEGHEPESGGVHDEIAKMLVATILSDRDAFRHLQSRFARDRGRAYFFAAHFKYDRLMDLILARSEAFDAALLAQEQSFLARATDQRAEHMGTLDACLDRNEFVFDVWAVALANLARHHGLTVRHSSDIIPIRDFEAPA
jgi:hypothetical protein